MTRTSLLKLVLSTMFCISAAACIGVAGDDLGTGEPASKGADDGEPTARAQEASGAACYNDCSCPLGTYCAVPAGSKHNGICTAPALFSPLPPTPPCYGTCQCNYGQVCNFNGGSYGACVTVPARCTTNCDCGPDFVCSSGQCSAAFGPYPECACNKQCPLKEQCVNGGCQ